MFFIGSLKLTFWWRWKWVKCAEPVWDPSYPWKEEFSGGPSPMITSIEREVKETGAHTYIHTQNLFYFPYMTHSPCSGNPPAYLEVTWMIIGAGWAGGRRLGGVPKLLPVLFPSLPPFPTQTPHFLIWQHWVTLISTSGSPLLILYVFPWKPSSLNFRTKAFVARFFFSK